VGGDEEELSWQYSSPWGRLGLRLIREMFEYNEGSTSAVVPDVCPE
jgi:hypothetical protein